MATGMLLQDAGYETIFINKAYALGILPYTAKELTSQRTQWAQGTKQIFDHFKPRLKGLSFMQKLCYYNSYLYWFTSFKKSFMAPTLFMVLISSSKATITIVAVLLPLSLWFPFVCMFPKIRNLTSSHIYDCFDRSIRGIDQRIYEITERFNVTKKRSSATTLIGEPSCPHHPLFTLDFLCLSGSWVSFVPGEGYESAISWPWFGRSITSMACFMPFWSGKTVLSVIVKPWYRHQSSAFLWCQDVRDVSNEFQWLPCPYSSRVDEITSLRW